MVKNNPGSRNSNLNKPASPYKKKPRPATPEFAERTYEQYEIPNSRPMNSYSRYDTG